MDSVLITGASSGIGEALALECARHGARTLFLGGRDRARLEGVAALPACTAEFIASLLPDKVRQQGVITP